MNVMTSSLYGFEKKLFVIEQPIPCAPPVDSTAQVLAQWNVVYDAHNEIVCLMLGSGRIHKSNKKSQNAKVKGKGKGNGKDKQGYISNPKNPKPSAKEHPTKDDTFHHCKEVGHWKRNCPAYLAELIKKIKKKKQGKMTRKRSNIVPKGDGSFWANTTDVYGLLRHVPRQGASYFITFTDDYSCYGYVYLLKHKHEVFEAFKVFKNEVENQLEKTIKALRSNRGGEYIIQEFKDYLKACGIVQQLTPSYTPQHNGVSEMRNRYPKETIGYYFYFPPENKIVVARYAEFLEKNLLSQEFSGRAEELEEIQDKDTSPSENTSKIPMEVKEVKEHSLGDLNEPNNYKAALLDPKYNKWVNAMNADMQSMKDNQVSPNVIWWRNPSSECRVECYCDAGFETDRDDTKSQTGYVFVLNGGAVDWKSSKQSTIAMSATESEYIAASEAAMEAVWIRKFISGLGIVPTINEPLNMYCDNSAAIHYANEPGVQRGARHYHRRYHYVRECVELGKIRILKVHTDNNLADPFTKALSNRKLTQHARSMGLRPASSFM
ncbi:retrotransposon protein, putative, ty1-copia subclass [Tanacetum coccineum]